MRLKLFTSLCLAAGAMLLIFAAYALGPIPPKGASKEVGKAYAKRSLAYLGGLLVAFTGSAVGAIMIVRRQREEYREEMMRNMQSLLEESLRSTGKGSTKSEP